VKNTEIDSLNEKELKGIREVAEKWKGERQRKEDG